jgi:phage host-nuclease inhibitor protein Gam
MSKRQKPQFTPITTLDECNQRLAELAEIEREMDAINYSLNEAIDLAKQEAKGAAQPLEERREQLEAALAAYAEYNKPTLFDSKKTIELLHGRFGYRKSTAIKPMKGFRIADVIEKIKVLGLKNALRTKESLNKDVMGEWADAQLNAVGAQREVQEKFWYEVKQEDVA